MRITDPHHRRVIEFLAQCVADAKSENLHDGLGTYAFEQAAKDIDNLVPGGLPFHQINTGTQEGWVKILHLWLNALISDHRS